MPVPNTIADLDVVAANNSPAGSDSIGTSLDDYLRSHAGIIKKLYADLLDGTVDVHTALSANTALTANDGVPAGTIIDFSGTTAPTGYLSCPLVATNISRTTYAALFAAIGTTWGAGDGSTTFGMPFFPEGYATVQANSNVATSTTGEVISHTHTATQRALNAGAANYYASVGSTAIGPGSISLESTGGAANLAAGVKVMKCVKI